MIITFGTIRIETFDTVYIPGEDTFFLEDSLKELVHSHHFAEDLTNIAEMGVGSGYITILLMKEFPSCHFYAIDKNQKALDCTRNNISLNNLPIDQVKFFQSDLYKNVQADPFDVIIFNPPYLPVEDNPTLVTTDPMYRSTWEGGNQVIQEFLQSSEQFLSQHGKIILILSHYQVKDGKIAEFIQQATQHLRVERFFKKQLSLETLYVVVVSKMYSTKDKSKD